MILCTSFLVSSYKSRDTSLRRILDVWKKITPKLTSFSFLSSLFFGLEFGRNMKNEFHFIAY
jgi:hypothetical protein